MEGFDKCLRLRRRVHGRQGQQQHLLRNQKDNRFSAFQANLQNDIGPENAFTVEIKVDPPADGNEAQTVTGNLSQVFNATSFSKE